MAAGTPAAELPAGIGKIRARGHSARYGLQTPEFPQRQFRRGFINAGEARQAL
jgi:hypothetical protein